MNDSITCGGLKNKIRDIKSNSLDLEGGAISKMKIISFGIIVYVSVTTALNMYTQSNGNCCL